MRVLGIDFGDRRIGLALSDPTGLFAQPYSVVKRKDDKQAIEQIRQVIDSQGVEQMVVGWPRNMNGSVGPRAEACEAFAKLLGESTGLSVDLFDERLTTVSAERLLLEADMRRKDRKQVVDAVAASILLQGYLDRSRNTPTRGDT